jgi:cell division septum initiation protein DivIVA
MRTARDAAQGAGDAARSAADSASSAYQATADAASSAYHTATDAASSAYRTAADTTADATNRVVDTTRQTADRVLRASRGGMQSVAECYTYLRSEQPLVLGAIAIVAGAAIGALLPTTRAENEWVGDASAAAKERLKGEARRRMDDMKEGVARVGEAARQSPGESNADAAGEQRAGG